MRYSELLYFLLYPRVSLMEFIESFILKNEI